MIASLRGQIIDIKPFYLHLEVGGVGYAVSIPLDVYDTFRDQKGNEIFLFTQVVYRDDGQFIFGFSNQGQAELFNFLLGLPGIGAKVALNLISTLGDVALLKALVHGEEKILTKTPRVGKSKAEKIIFESKGRKKKLQELADKVAGKNTSSNQPSQAEADLGNEEEITLFQVEEALVSLGFQKKEIDGAYGKISKSKIELPAFSEDNLQELIRIFLSHL